MNTQEQLEQVKAKLKSANLELRAALKAVDDISGRIERLHDKRNQLASIEYITRKSLKPDSIKWIFNSWDREDLVAIRIGIQSKKPCLVSDRRIIYRYKDGKLHRTPGLVRHIPGWDKSNTGPDLP